MIKHSPPAPGQRIVHRRKVFYISGFDPRGPAWYHGIYARESARQAALSGMQLEVSKRQTRTPMIAAWAVQAETQGHRTSTDYVFLRWDDVVRMHWPRGLSLVWLTFWVVWEFIRHGILGRVLRSSWPTFICGTYPAVSVLILAIAATALGLGCGWALAWLAGWPAWTAWPIAAAVAIPATIQGTHLLDRKASIHWLTRIYAFNIRMVHRQAPELERRLDAFAPVIAEAAQSGEWDEILIVGHSTGAQAAVSALARALELDPKLGRRGAQLSLLTLGGSIPMLAWWPQAQWFRDQLARVAGEPGLDWLDFTLAQDGACFVLHDPVQSSGLAHPAGAEPKPKLLSAKLFELYAPEGLRVVRRQWYMVHFQYLMAGERLGDYDYFAITAGPLTLPDRYSHRSTTRDFDRFKLKIFGQ